MYEEKFSTLWTEISKTPSKHEAFLKDPKQALESIGIPVIEKWTPDSQANEDPATARAAVEKAQSLIEKIDVNAQPQSFSKAAAESLKVKKHWWGVDFVMNQKLTEDVITGVAASGSLGGVIGGALGAAGVVTGGIATVIGAGIAAIIAAKVAQIKITNNGKGVHWPVTWIQWGVLAAAVPTGPPGVVAAGMVIFNPVRN